MREHNQLYGFRPSFTRADRSGIRTLFTKCANCFTNTDLSRFAYRAVSSRPLRGHHWCLVTGRPRCRSAAATVDVGVDDDTDGSIKGGEELTHPLKAGADWEGGPA